MCDASGEKLTEYYIFCLQIFVCVAYFLLFKKLKTQRDHLGHSEKKRPRSGGKDQKGNIWHSEEEKKERPKLIKGMTILK